MPKKWPASVDLQAFKKSKGLQEQQSQSQSNTPAPHILTISMKRIRTANAPFSAFKCASRNPLLQTILCQGRPEIGLRMAGPNPLSAALLGKRSEEFGQFTGEKIQSKGRIRKSLVFDTFPCQPHLGLSQAISSSPKIFIASFSESAGLEHFRCKLILCPPLGHAKTIL